MDEETLAIPTVIRRKEGVEVTSQITASKIMRLAILNTALAHWEAVQKLRHATYAEQQLAAIYIEELHDMIQETTNKIVLGS